MQKTLLAFFLITPFFLGAQLQVTDLLNDSSKSHFLVSEYAWWDGADSTPVPPPKETVPPPKEEDNIPPKNTPPFKPTPPKPKPKPKPQPVEKSFNFDNILSLEERLNNKVIGQEEAIKATVDSILPYTIGIHDPNKPVANLLFIGTTGVGKTELAKALALELSGNATSSFIRINMSEYVLEDGVNKIIGAGVGYKDSEKGGILANAILENSHSIVLLDEFEKASPLVHKVFLQIFDEGYFTTGTGTHVDCRHCIFIATTNLGAEKLQQAYEADVDYVEIIPYLEPELMKKLSPELYNRLEPVLFKVIDETALLNIAANKLYKLSSRIQKTKEINIEFDTSVFDYLMTYGYNIKLGARPLNRIIDKEISSTITRFFIIHKPEKGANLTVIHDGSNFVVH